MTASTIRRYVQERIIVDSRFAWSARWWQFGCVIVSAGGRTWQAQADAPLPADAEALGCSGTAEAGYLAWVGWDLDCGHGVQSYGDLDAAVADARKIRDALHGRAEIRLSKSGRGVHIRHALPAQPDDYEERAGILEFDAGFPRPDAEEQARKFCNLLPPSAGPLIAKSLAAKLNVKADPSPLGRQSFWLWTATLKPDAFRLIESHKD